MKAYQFKDCTNQFVVEFENSVLEPLLQQSVDAGKLETGGVLLGYYDSSLHKAVIVKGSEAPLDSIKCQSTFYRGVKGLRFLLEKEWINEQIYYIGEWHSHPFSSSHMSNIDLQQMRMISEDESMYCPEPILLIIGGDISQDFSLSIYVFPRAKKPISLQLYER